MATQKVRKNGKELEAKLNHAIKARNDKVHVSERRGVAEFEGKAIGDKAFGLLVKAALKEYRKVSEVKETLADKAAQVFESKDIANFRRMTSRQGKVLGIDRAGDDWNDEDNATLAYVAKNGLTWKVAGAILHRSEVSCWAQGQKFGFAMPRGTTLSDELKELVQAWENAVQHGKLQAAKEDGVKIKA